MDSLDSKWTGWTGNGQVSCPHNMANPSHVKWKWTVGQVFS